MRSVSRRSHLNLDLANVEQGVVTSAKDETIDCRGSKLNKQDGGDPIKTIEQADANDLIEGLTEDFAAPKVIFSDRQPTHPIVERTIDARSAPSLEATIQNHGSRSRDHDDEPASARKSVLHKLPPHLQRSLDLKKITGFESVALKSFVP